MLTLTPGFASREACKGSADMVCSAKDCQGNKHYFASRGNVPRLPWGSQGDRGWRGGSVLLIWCSLGKASIMGDVLRIKLPSCKAAACTRSGCRFMLLPKQNEQHRSHLGFGGNEPFHHIDFLKHLKKKALSAAGICAWLWRICPHFGPLALAGVERSGVPSHMLFE